MGRHEGGVGGGIGAGVRCGEDGLHPAAQTGLTERPHVLQIHRCRDNLHLSQTELGSLRGDGGRRSSSWKRGQRCRVIVVTV